MREITELKFRQLNPNGGFHYWGYIDKKYKTTFTAPIFGQSEQYTGLKDKNGKDIYEGDILTWCINNIVKIGSVYYDEFQACFWMGKDKTTGFLVLNDWMRGDYEIIGNIHE